MPGPESVTVTTMSRLSSGLRAGVVFLALGVAAVVARRPRRPIPRTTFRSLAG
ncbi:hypothetical protein BZL30_7342 [Mycobacterium kansasii]|uniref:Uncharacterized protein n=1 Tax=Mycobacterium kansasii TaxID=1768 RepID=A0A1V3WR18_MYCKA|nr:hypothetical protein BZL30_7342 [Mycobacterium kansasii]